MAASGATGEVCAGERFDEAEYLRGIEARVAWTEAIVPVLTEAARVVGRELGQGLTVLLAVGGDMGRALIFKPWMRGIGRTCELVTPYDRCAFLVRAEDGRAVTIPFPAAPGTVALTLASLGRKRNFGEMVGQWQSASEQNHRKGAAMATEAERSTKELEAKANAFRRLLAKAECAAKRKTGDSWGLLGAGVEVFYRLPVLVSKTPNLPGAEADDAQSKHYRRGRSAMQAVAWESLVWAVALCRAERVSLDYAEVPYLPKRSEWFVIASRSWSTVLHGGCGYHPLRQLVENLIALCLYGCQRLRIPGLALGMPSQTNEVAL